MISSLKPNEFIVVGTNESGHHYGGSAKQAFDDFGALWGNGYGPLGGQSYGIVTLNTRMEQVSLDYIGQQALLLSVIAKENPDKIFYLTPVGCGIANFKISDIEQLFKDMPKNVIKTEEWNDGE
jgi:hypothetical protein